MDGRPPTLKEGASKTPRAAAASSTPPAVDSPEQPPYIARLRSREMDLRSRHGEAHLPAQQACSQAAPWVPGTDGYAGRAPGSGVAPRQGPQTPLRLGRRIRRIVTAPAVALGRLKLRAEFLRVG